MAARISNEPIEDAEGNQIVTARLRWEDTAQHVIPILVNIEGVPVQTWIGQDLGVATIDVEMHVWAPRGTNLDLIAHQVMHAWQANMQPLQVDFCRLREVRTSRGIRDLLEVGRAVNNLPGIGDTAGTRFPANMAVLVTLQTLARPRRVSGRMHIPGVQAPDNEGASGKVLDPLARDMVPAIRGFWEELIQAGLTWAVASPYREGGQGHRVTGWVLHRSLVGQPRRRFDGYGIEQTFIASRLG